MQWMAVAALPVNNACGDKIGSGTAMRSRAATERNVPLWVIRR
jgi:hypothetical protein